MEEEPSDPHEQQLLAVFKSCLANGRSSLDKKGLLALCGKLELEPQHRDSILELLELDADRAAVTFYEFRDGFLALLGKSQESCVVGSRLEKEANGEVVQQGPRENGITMCEGYGHREGGKRKQEAVVNCQQIQAGEWWGYLVCLHCGLVGICVYRLSCDIWGRVKSVLCLGF